MTPAIEVSGLVRRFKSFTAVDNISFTVNPGEVFGFLGPNGAGKTTTVRMLTALIAPTSGTAVVSGYRIGKEDGQVRRSVGILTETPGLYDGLSAERNLRIFASLYEVRDPDAQIEKYLRMLGLWERRGDAAATLSKGMKQKLAIARALLHEPRVLFLDEPTAALDPEAAHLVHEFIIALRREGRTIFLCTHNLDEADRLCDRIGVFKTHLLVMDTPARLRAQLFGRKVVFHLRRADQALTEAAGRLPFVKGCQLVDNKLVLTLDDPEDHNPEVVRLLVGLGADVQFVGELRRSLEDVYLQLIKGT
jgi:ABC-2 type transport system ATP-binding protein